MNFPILTTKVRDKVFTDKQWQDIQSTITTIKTFYYILVYCNYTGCRPSEIVNLKKSDIDDKGIIRIYQSKVLNIFHIVS